MFTRFVEQLDVAPYRDARVVVKGCSTLPVPLNACVELAASSCPRCARADVGRTLQHCPCTSG